MNENFPLREVSSNQRFEKLGFDVERLDEIKIAKFAIERGFKFNQKIETETKRHKMQELIDDFLTRYYWVGRRPHEFHGYGSLLRYIYEHYEETAKILCPGLARPTDPTIFSVTESPFEMRREEEILDYEIKELPSGRRIKILKYEKDPKVFEKLKGKFSDIGEKLAKEKIEPSELIKRGWKV